MEEALGKKASTTILGHRKGYESKDNSESMLVNQAFRFELDPTNLQRTALDGDERLTQ